ncbi:MAG: hypothetical protein GY750_02985 [Lentisphaerae bacterium]|nr:hypothetical protein [Lentisphaerota bacterium]
MKRQFKTKKMPIELYFLEFFEKYYYREQDLKNKLFTRLGIILTTLSIIFACYLKIYNPPPLKGNYYLLSVFYLFSIISFLVLIRMAIYLFMIIFIGKYKIISSPKKFKQYAYRLMEYHKKGFSKENLNRTKNDFDCNLIDQYVECANDWYHKNIKLGSLTHKVTVYLFILITSTFFSVCCYLANAPFLTK